MIKIAYSIPSNVLTNEELSNDYPEWSPEKIYSKTGIVTRGVVSSCETALDLAEKTAGDAGD